MVDAHLKKDSHSLELVIEGRKLAEIRGNNREQIPFGDIVQIGDYIKLDYPFASLAERVKEKT
ncbi:MAG: hypothetical protein KKD39_08245 [Candidatus Altiarchaeota archaeon]|nr:hypothetical protein [Candidatus Altiarchaeota archaeon]